jgi:hypothetical protein
MPAEETHRAAKHVPVFPFFISLLELALGECWIRHRR